MGKAIRNLFLICIIIVACKAVNGQDIGLEVSHGQAVLFGDSLQGNGNRMMWISSNGAFRAGSVNEDVNVWNLDSIGPYSAAFGYNNLARTTAAMAWGIRNSVNGPQGTAWGAGNRIILDADSGFSTAWGVLNYVSGAKATVWGEENIVNGNNSTAWGVNNQLYSSAFNATTWGNSNDLQASLTTAWGQFNTIDTTAAEKATAWGEYNHLKGELSTSWGSQNTSSGKLATSWGKSNKVLGEESTAWGSTNQALGHGATVMGENNIVNGYRATAVGSHLVNRGAASLTIGQYNDPLINDAETEDDIAFSGTPLFIIGNGVPDGPSSNALTVMDNGRVKIGNGTPVTDLHVKSSENSDGASGGGIRLESQTDNNYWQLTYAPDDKLNFIRNGTREAYVSTDGSWNQLINFPQIAKNGTPRKSVNKSPVDVTKIQIGISDTENHQLDLNPIQILEDLPNLVRRDRDGNPIAINYQQINLLTLQTTKDQARQLENQQKLIENLILQLEITNKKIDQIQKTIKK